MGIVQNPMFLPLIYKIDTDLLKSFMIDDDK